MALRSLAPRESATTLEIIKKRGYMIVSTEDDLGSFGFIKEGKHTGFNKNMVEVLKT